MERIVRRLGFGVALVASIAGRAEAQTVRLQLRPRLGDTLHLRLDQKISMVGTTRVGRADSTLTVASTLMVATRVAVEGRDENGTTVLAMTDSVALAHAGADSARAAEMARRQLQGRRIRMRIAPNGATTIIPGADESIPELQQLFSQMPATLPDRNVAVGDRWTRTMVVPLAADPRVGATGTLKAVFQFDSLARGGDLAYLSMSGSLSRSPATPSAERLGTLEMVGEMSGTLVIDRRRGWITDARTTVIVYSLVGSRLERAERAVRTRMTVAQRLRAW